jgi:hypothetical protein
MKKQSLYTILALILVLVVVGIVLLISFSAEKREQTTNDLALLNLYNVCANYNNSVGPFCYCMGYATQFERQKDLSFTSRFPNLKEAVNSATNKVCN